MPDREKVIKELHDARRYLEDKEKPMKPNRYWFNRNLYKCGACRKTLDIIEHNYCPQCGQKIDWSEYPTEEADGRSGASQADFDVKQEDVAEIMNTINDALEGSGYCAVGYDNTGMFLQVLIECLQNNV